MRFWDTSALLPLFVDEPATESCLALMTSDPSVIVWEAQVSNCNQRSRVTGVTHPASTTCGLQSATRSSIDGVRGRAWATWPRLPFARNVWSMCTRSRPATHSSWQRHSSRARTSRICSLSSHATWRLPRRHASRGFRWSFRPSLQRLEECDQRLEVSVGHAGDRLHRPGGLTTVTTNGIVNRWCRPVVQERPA